jgi:hypothetical protein
MGAHAGATSVHVGCRAGYLACLTMKAGEPILPCELPLKAFKQLEARAT